MRVHHLNCASMRAPLHLLAGKPRRHPRSEHIVSHCLLLETDNSLVLVDTGIGLDAVADPQTYLGAGFTRFQRPLLDPEETAIRQLRRLGYAPEDVRHIVLTHLDVDHAGGIADFPHAQIHLSGPELRAATAPKTRIDRVRYRQPLWAHGPDWVAHEPSRGERWFGFEAVRPMNPSLGENILLIPLEGHTRGHVGIAIDTGHGWLLHAGDAYLLHHEAHTSVATSNLALALLTWAQGSAYRNNQARLRQLTTTHAQQVTVFCSHDPTEFHQLHNRSTDTRPR